MSSDSPVSMAQSYDVSNPAPRSRNASKHSQNDYLAVNLSGAPAGAAFGIGNTPSRVSLGSVLANQPVNFNDSATTMGTQLTHENLRNQKQQMQRNNEDLCKYMDFRRELERNIKRLEKENEKLRRERNMNNTGSEEIVPEFKPRDHRRQKEINQLHEAIVSSQKQHDEKEAEIERMNSQQKKLQNDTVVLMEKARRLNEEKQENDAKAAECQAKIPAAVEVREQILNEIARQEAEFRAEYNGLQKKLAEVKPIVIPKIIPDSKHMTPNIQDLKDQMNRIRDQVRRLANNAEKERELAAIRDKKDNLQKQCDALLKQTNILEQQCHAISEKAIEQRQLTNSKRAEVKVLESSLNQEQREQEDKMDYLNDLYRELYDQYKKLLDDIAEQKKKSRDHQSIKEELELMRKLLKMGSNWSLTPTDYDTDSVKQESHHGAQGGSSGSQSGRKSPSGSIITLTDDKVDIDFRKIGGTIYEHTPFNPAADAEALHKAMKGLGTDEDAMNSILANRTLKQRREIYRAYNKMYVKKTLDAMIQSDTSGAYRKCLLSLLDNFGTLDARSVHSAIEKGDIIQIVMTLGTRTHVQINQMQTAYNKMYESTVYGDIKSRFEDQLLQQFMRHLIRGERSVSGKTILKKEADQEYELLRSHPCMHWNRLDVMEQILPCLTSRPFEYIYYLTKIRWHDDNPHVDICEAVTKALPDSNYKVALKSYLSLVTILPAQNFARQMHHAIVDKNRDALTYYVISRSELDTIDIKKVYYQMYGKKVQDEITKKLGKGDYERLLLEILKVNQ